MTQLTPPSDMVMAPGSPRAARESNVYTVLALIAVLALASALGFVWWKNTTLTGNSNPFFIEPPAAVR